MPRRLVRNYHDLLRYCDIRIDYDRFIGFVMLFGIGVAFAAAFDLFILLGLPFTVVFFSAFLLFEASVYIWLSLSADGKGKFVDTILPDALQLMAMNMKAGMTTDRALLQAARPEFGPLERELSKAGKQVLSGKEIKYALSEIPKGIKSGVLDRTIRLIVEGIESGGEISALLEQTAEDIQSTRLVQSEIQANVMMYAIFIFFAVGIGAPLLYGISTYLVEILSKQFSLFQISDTMISSMQFMGGKISIDTGFLILFTLVSLAVTSVFGGLIIGMIKGGRSKDGIKYIPMLMLLSFAVFFAVRSMVAGMFSGL